MCIRSPKRSCNQYLYHNRRVLVIHTRSSQSESNMYCVHMVTASWPVFHWWMPNSIPEKCTIATTESMPPSFELFNFANISITFGYKSLNSIHEIRFSSYFGGIWFGSDSDSGYICSGTSLDKSVFEFGCIFCFAVALWIYGVVWFSYGNGNGNVISCHCYLLQWNA